jgi:hypothetical protein
LPGPMGAVELQSSLLVQSGQAPGLDAAGALALGLLLGKNGESKEKDDSWKALAMLAMAAGMQQQQGGQSISFSQSITQVEGAYAAAAGGSACAAAGSVSVQA